MDDLKNCEMKTARKLESEKKLLKNSVARVEPLQNNAFLKLTPPSFTKFTRKGNIPSSQTLKQIIKRKKENSVPGKIIHNLKQGKIRKCASKLGAKSSIEDYFYGVSRSDKVENSVLQEPNQSESKNSLLSISDI